MRPCGPRRGYRALPTEPPCYELPGIAGSERRDQASVQWLGIARRFARGVDAHSAKVRFDSGMEGLFCGMFQRLARVQLRSDWKLANKLVVDRGDGQLTKPRDSSAQQVRLVQASSGDCDEWRAQGLKFRRCRVQRVTVAVELTCITSRHADEILPATREREPFVNIVPHLNIRIVSMLTMSR